MLLGALVDAGVSFALLEETAAALDVGARLEMRRVTRGGIAASKADVVTPDSRALDLATSDAEHAHTHEGHSHAGHSHQAHIHAEHAQQRGSGGRDTFHRLPGRVNGSIAKQGEGSRRRHGKRSMLTLDCPAAHVERRGKPSIDAKGFTPCCGADNVDNGVHRTHFMKMDLLNRNGMDGGFRFTKKLKGAHGAGFDGLRQRSRLDNGQYR